MNTKEKQKRSKRESIKDLLFLMDKYNIDYEIIGNFINWDTPIEVKCNKCGNIFIKSPQQLVAQRRHTCSECKRLKAFNEGKERFFERVKEQKIVKVLSEYIGVHEPIEVECLKNPSHHWVTTPHQITQKGCPYCSNKIIKKGINSFGDVYPELVKFFKYRDIAYQISPKSGRKIKLKCPDCGYEKEEEVKYLANSGFSCPLCGDDTSRPNKFLMLFLIQANNLGIIDYKNFEWNPLHKTDYRCDGSFVYDNKQYVIEMQGKQHRDGWKGRGEISKKKIKESDEYKKNKLKELEIILIEIECYDTRFSHIYKNFISNKFLKTIFDFEIFDWEYIKNNLDKNIKRQICRDFDEDINITANDLSEKYGISLQRIIQYLKSGDYFGWCDFENNTYRAKTRGKKSVYNIRENRFVVYKDDILLEYFDSMNKACNFIKDNYNYKIRPEKQNYNKLLKQGFIIIKDIDLSPSQLIELEQFQHDKQEKHKQKRKEELAKKMELINASNKDD